MKKIIALLCAVLALSASGVSAAENEAAAQLLTKKYAFSDFRSLSVSNSFEVNLVQDEKWFVEVEYSDYLEDYLAVSVNGETLRLGLKSLPRFVQKLRKNRSAVLKATVHMPRLEKLSMSGATGVTVQGQFSLPGGVFELDMSGASKLENMAMDASKARLSLSGASYCKDLTGSFHELDMKVSGAGKCRIDAAVNEWEVSLSGAADVVLRGPECKKLEIDSSGAAKADVAIPSDILKYEGSGASSLSALDAPTRKAEIELSGGSSCRIAVSESLEAESSGASVCRYKTLNGALQIIKLSTTGGGRVISL